MMKFNFAGLNNRLKPASNSEQNKYKKASALDDYVKDGYTKDECQAERDTLLCPKPRYSAYRTVVARHEQFAARIKAKNDCDDGACDQNPCNKDACDGACDCTCNGDCDNDACNDNI